MHEAQDIKDNKDRLFHRPGGDIIIRDANSLPFMAEQFSTVEDAHTFRFWCFLLMTHLI